MRFLKQTFAALSLGLLALSAAASSANPQVDSDYRVLEPAQPVESGKKVEVTEFFWYSCPHCAAFDPALSAWVKKQGDKIVFKQVPIAFRDSFAPQQKLYYALEAMGLAGVMNPKIFRAIHVDKQKLDSDSSIVAFIVKDGVEVDNKKLSAARHQEFSAVYASFGVQTKVKRATQLQNSYQVDGVPMLAIGGRYLTAPSIAGSSLANQPESMQQAATLQVMDFLVQKVAAEQSATKLPAAKK